MKNQKEFFSIGAEVLNEARTYITDSSNFDWVPFNSAEEMRKLLDDYTLRIKNGDINAVRSAYDLFLPTGAIQEHAISNGWTDKYMKLANRFDEVYRELVINDQSDLPRHTRIFSRLRKIMTVLLLFLTETFLQLLYYAVVANFFDESGNIDTLPGIWLDGLYYLGSVKAVFYLPVYLIYYFIIQNDKLSPLKLGLFHCLIFLLLSLFLIILIPWGIAGNFYNTLPFTLIAFLTSFILFKSMRPKKE